jgi:hypothetical protein
MVSGRKMRRRVTCNKMEDGSDEGRNRINIWVQAPCTKALRQAFCAPHSVPGYRSLVPLAKFQMAPTPSTLMSSGFKKVMRLMKHKNLTSDDAINWKL